MKIKGIAINIEKLIELPHFQDIHESGQNFKLTDEQIGVLELFIKNHKNKGLDIYCSDVVRLLGNQEWKLGGEVNE